MEAHQPHLLSVTSRALPKAFALVLYGHFMVSVMDESTQRRKTVRTMLVADSLEARRTMYGNVKAALHAGV